MHAGALADDAGGSMEKSGAETKRQMTNDIEAVLGYSWKNKVTCVAILEIRVVPTEAMVLRGGKKCVEG